MSILNQLPEVRGSYASNEPMSNHTWFGVGGPADIIFNPTDEDDLVHFLAACPDEIPLFTVGAGSNLLVRDGGIAGVVIKLSTHMKQITHTGTCITAQTGRVTWTHQLDAPRHQLDASAPSAAADDWAHASWNRSCACK